MRRLLAVLLAAVVPAGAPAQDAGDRRWDFVARLDGKPIGQHRFTLHVDAEGGAGAPLRRTLSSDAEFAVKVLGFTVYRYRHHAIEHWAGDCLAAVSAQTDDNGTRTTVHAEARGDGMVVTASPAAPDAASRTTTGCLASFAYWNPAALRSRPRLLNDQTGELTAVSVTPIAGGLRIVGAPHPLEVWYSPEGDWTGLDSVVDGGRRLTYRLR